MAKNELPIDCTPLNHTDWQKRLDEQSGEYGKAYVRTGDPKYQNILDYLLNLNDAGRGRPDCCITYVSPSGDLGILECETKQEARAALDKLNSALNSYN